MATFPQAVIPAFAAGYAPFPSAMNGWVQAPVGFCSSMTMFRGQQQLAGGQALSPGFSVLQIGGTAGDILEDPYTGWSHVATGSQPANSYLVPFTGWYEVTVVTSNTAQGLWGGAGVKVSGGTAEYMGNVSTPPNVSGGACGSLIIPCTGGLDYIQAGPVVSAAAATDTSSAGRWPSVEIAYVSGG